MLRVYASHTSCGGLSHIRRKAPVPRLRRWMSVRPEQQHKTPDARKKVTIAELQKMRDAGTPISMLTTYDYPSARALSANPQIDIAFVGDSLAQVCLGHTSTTELTLDEMIHHTRAVRRGTKHPLLLADMPFGSYNVSAEDTLRNAVRLVQQGGAEAVKMEGGVELAGVVRRLGTIGIPVMAHIGLMPQRCNASGFRVQGRDAESARGVLADALALEDAGAFAVVLEAIPHKLGEYITNRLRIPTIGIGAGNMTSGQVLVWDDMMGTWAGHKAKFVRRFADVKTERDAGVQRYAAAVRDRSFPSATESYAMDDAEWNKFLRHEEK